MLEVIQMEVDVAEGGEFSYECPYGPVNGEFDEVTGPSIIARGHLVMLEDITGNLEPLPEPDFAPIEPIEAATGALQSSENLSRVKNAKAYGVKVAENSMGFRLHFKSPIARRLRLTIVKAIKYLPLEFYQHFRRTWKCEFCKRAIRELLRFLLLIAGVSIVSLDKLEPVGILIDEAIRALEEGPVAEFLGELDFGNQLTDILRGILSYIKDATSFISKLIEEICRELNMCR